MASAALCTKVHTASKKSINTDDIPSYRLIVVDEVHIDALLSTSVYLRSVLPPGEYKYIILHRH